MRCRTLLFCTVVFAVGSAPRAQVVGSDGGVALAIGSERFPVRVTTMGVYQRLESDEGEVTETTVPLTVSAPLGRNVAFRLRASYASVDGTPAGAEDAGAGPLAPVSGLADAQASLSYYRPVGAGSIVGSVSVNVPSGQRSLTAEEARTTFLLGQGFYGFGLPSLGQGFNVAPAVTWAFPLGDGVAAGLGVAYQVRGGFEPLAARDGSAPVTYDPGDEVLLTAGVDYRLGTRLEERGRLSLDATYALYGEDTFGDLVFTSGDAVTVTGQWFGRLGAHEARVLARFRSKGERTFPEVDGVALGDAVVPTSGRVRGQVRFVLGERFRLGALVQGRYYATSDLFPAKTVADVGVSPEYAVSPGLVLVLRVDLTAGDVRGLTVGGGLAWTL